MKTHLFKSLLICFISIIFFIHANAQIVYTDVNPDLTTSSYNLDLNHDGTTDFVIAQTTSVVTGSIHCSGTRINRYLQIIASAGNQVLNQTMNLNTVIDQGSGTWYSSKSLTSSTNSCHCNSCFGCPLCIWNWLLVNSTVVTSKYFGLKLVVGSQTYYGWLHANATSSPMNCTIMDYGYNSVPDERILSGQTTADDYIFVSPMTNVLCSGSNVSIPYTIVGNFNASNVITAQLSDAAGDFTSAVNVGSTISNVSGTINATIPVSTLAGTTYRIRVTTSNPVRLSSNITTTSNNGINLIVNTSVPASVITTSGSTNICNGNVALSTATASGNSYQWKLNGNIIPNAIYYYYSANAAGDYSCLKTNGCGSAPSNIITLVATPVAAVITASGSTNLCNGNVALTTISTSGTTYQWQLNNNNILNAISNNYTATTAGDYTCIKTNGCGNVTSNIITITSSAVAAVITASGATTTCGTNVFLSTTTGTGNSYQWQLNGVNISGATNYYYNAPLTGSYSCIKTNGCGSITSNVISVIVNPLPGTVTVSPSGAINFCQGDSVVLTSSNPGGITYTWKVDGILINGATSPVYTTHAGGNYTAIITNSFGCSRTSNTVSLTMSTGIPAGVITLSGVATFCINSSAGILLAAYHTGETYQWKKNGVNISGETYSDFYPNATGNYSCFIINACGSILSNVIHITILSAPSATITAQGSTTFCTGDSVLLKANSNTAYTYHWVRNSVNISGATSVSYYAKTAGSYKCKVINTCGSKTSAAINTTVPCRTTNDIVDALEQLSIYPNPTTNSVIIKFPLDKAGELSIVNFSGQIIYTEKVITSQTEIDVSKFSEGIYVVKWNSGENNKTKTFSIIR